MSTGEEDRYLSQCQIFAFDDLLLGCFEPETAQRWKSILVPKSHLLHSSDVDLCYDGDIILAGYRDAKL